MEEFDIMLENLELDFFISLNVAVMVMILMMAIMVTFCCRAWNLSKIPFRQNVDDMSYQG